MMENNTTKELYKQWLQDKNPSALGDALYYVQGLDPHSPEAKFYKRSTNWLFVKAILNPSKYDVGPLRSMLALQDPNKSFWSMLSLKNINVVAPIEFTFYIYQFISEFPEELFEAYAEITGEELFLTDYSPVKFFYATQTKLDLWEIKKACCLVAHTNPDWRFWKPYGGYLPPVDNRKIIGDMVKMAETSIRAKQLECFEGNPNVVSPWKFLQWAIKKNLHPHPTLLESVQECASDALEPNQDKLEGTYPKNENIHHRQVEAVAKTLKHLYPHMTIAEIEKHHGILEFAGGKHYLGKHTLRRWISGSFPKGAFQWGRPKKNSKKNSPPQPENDIS
jgi:hypothetical protein